MLGESRIWHKCSLPKWLDQHEWESKKLPECIARRHTGSEEEFKFLFNEDTRAEFCRDKDMLVHTNMREVIVGGQMLRRRISIHEIYEAACSSGLPLDLKQLGLDISTFQPTEQSRDFLVKSDDDGSKLEMHSGLEMLAQVHAFGRRWLSIQWHKGLGKMNSSQLAEKTMNPATRKLIQVSVADAAAAEAAVSMLMGEDVEIRRAFIEDNALDARYLDQYRFTMHTDDDKTEVSSIDDVMKLATSTTRGSLWSAERCPMCATV
jgi:hypothetical protein